MALELNEDQAFQHAMWRVERIGWGVILLIIIAAALGLTGRGPLGETTVGDSTFRVRYDRIMRNGAPGSMTVYIGQPALRDSVVWLWASRPVVESCAPHRIVPSPARMLGSPEGVIFAFSIVPGTSNVVIRFDCESQRTGGYIGDIGLAMGPHSEPGENQMLRIRGFVLP